MAVSIDFTRFQDATTVFLIMYRYIQIKFNIYGGNVNKSTDYIINSQIQNNNPVLTDMDVNKGRCLRCFQL